MRATNVGRLERAASVGIGALLLTRLLRQRSAGRAAGALAGAALLYRGASGHCPAYEALGTGSAGTRGDAADDAVVVERSTTIAQPADALDRLWRAPRTLSQVMAPQVRVEPAPGTDGRTHWTLHGPGGQMDEWDMQRAPHRPGEPIRWETRYAEAPIEALAVRLREVPAGAGDASTEMILRVRLRLPRGLLGQAVSGRLGGLAPGAWLSQVLDRFESLAGSGQAETGHEPR